MVSTSCKSAERLPSHTVACCSRFFPSSFCASGKICSFGFVGTSFCVASVWSSSHTASGSSLAMPSSAYSTSSYNHRCSLLQTEAHDTPQHMNSKQGSHACPCNSIRDQITGWCMRIADQQSQKNAQAKSKEINMCKFCLWPNNLVKACTLVNRAHHHNGSR